MFRAFVPLTNINAFYAAFNVQPGDKLYRPPADRVKIW
jgi:putative endopeptidase